MWFQLDDHFGKIKSCIVGVQEERFQKLWAAQVGLHLMFACWADRDHCGTEIRVHVELEVSKSDVRQTETSTMSTNYLRWFLRSQRGPVSQRTEGKITSRKWRNLLQ